ncbi:hypothetical protein [Candidatus Enterococcus lemimoniae]|uniref:Flagellar FliJ protein n=1 Tax=Candidatus Enterococcus lemimoniae TaxID=1834167 RepID=A0ABZ2T7U8_9ENTE|nr:hypothetical protein [Enterococcus sp. 12C11_DIV0727]OTO70635.1 hypothetical protein A5866_002872 [Enterococcus sp. 12C11_DIV0727]
MDKKKSVIEVSNQLSALEDEKLSIHKKKNLWEEYQEHWAYLQKEEQSILEEVAYLSLGTESMNHATQELMYFEEEQRAASQAFDSIEEGFEQKEKELYDREDHLNAAYYETKKQVEVNDDEI